MDDCDACIGNVLYNSLNYFDNHLYYIARDKSSYMCSLYKISCDGSEHMKICDFGTSPDESNSYYSYAVTDKYIFYSQSIGSEGTKNNAKLVKFNIRDNSEEVLYNYEEVYASIFDLKISNNTLLFRKSSNDNLLYTELYKLDLADRKITRVEDNICSCTVQNDKLTYWKVQDGIYTCNLEGNNKSKIFTSDNRTMLGNVANMGENYYFENTANLSFDKNSENISGEMSKDKIETIINLKQKEQMIIPLYVAKDRLLVEVWKRGGGHYKGYYKINNSKLDSNLVILGDID